MERRLTGARRNILKLDSKSCMSVVVFVAQTLSVCIFKVLTVEDSGGQSQASVGMLSLGGKGNKRGVTGGILCD